MQAWMWILLILVVIAVAAGAYFFGQRRRQQRVKETFGPEYDRVAEERGRGRARRELTEREKRRSKLDIRPLQAERREHYTTEWKNMQSRFVDDPVAAVRDADVLVIEVMRERGYPMDDFDQRAADVSVDHPDVVHNYRSGHAIAMSSDRGEASTEELRTATLHYRALFQELLSPGRDDEPAKIAQAERREARDRGSDGRGAGTESTQRRA